MGAESQHQSTDLSLKDKLNVLDREIRLLHRFCLNSGYSPSEIELLAKPFYSDINKTTRRKTLGSGLKCLILCGVFAAVIASVIYYDPAYKLTLAYGRYAFIKVLPLWDWTDFYDECFLDNPFSRRSKALTEEDCQVCDEIREVKHMQNVSMEEVSDRVIRHDFPIIVEDGMRDWFFNGKVDLKYLDEVYNSDQALRECMACMFSSNVQLGFPNHHVLLRKALGRVIIKYYAHWQNCLKQAAKAFRQFYKRPYFLPPMVELADSNWVFVSSDYKEEQPLEVPIDLPLIIMAQLKGQMKIFLKPYSPCSKSCPNLSDVLKEGQIIVIPADVWSVDYLPDGSENIAVGVGGTFD